MNSNSTNSASASYCLESLPRRSSFYPSSHHQNDNVLSPPLTPAVSQHQPFNNKRDSTDLAATYNYSRPTYPLDNYHHWMNNHSTMQQQLYHHRQQQQIQYHHHHHHLEQSLRSQQQSTSHVPNSPIPPPLPSQRLNNNLLTTTTNNNMKTINSITITDNNNNTNNTTIHNSRKQPTKQNKHLCTFPKCLWSFKRFEHLKRHMLVHTGERPHVCPHPGCGKRFSRSDNFHAHFRTHEKKAMTRQEKKVQSTTLPPPPPPPLTSIKKENEEERMERMNIKQKQTTTSTTSNNNSSHFISDNLYNHPYPLLPTPHHKQQSNTHFVNYNPNLVVQNSSSFALPSVQKKSLIEIEETKKPHACTHPDCERRFRRLEHLRRHMRIHTHEQPFKCNFPGCFKAFSRSDNLSQHRKTHERRNHNNSRLSTNKLVEESFLHQQQNPHVVTHSNGNNNVHDSFTLAEFIRDNQYNNTTITATTATTANTNNTKQQHSLLAWQHPGDTSTESVGC